VIEEVVSHHFLKEDQKDFEKRVRKKVPKTYDYPKQNEGGRKCESMTKKGRKNM
jgi:hypothetical protein